MNLSVTASTCVWFFGRLEWASRTRSWSAWCSGNPKFWPGHTHPLSPSIPRNSKIVIIEWLKNYIYDGILTLHISISTALKLYITNVYRICLQNQENLWTNQYILRKCTLMNIETRHYGLGEWRPPRKSSERLPLAQNLTSDDRGRLAINCPCSMLNGNWCQNLSSKDF